MIQARVKVQVRVFPAIVDRRGALLAPSGGGTLDLTRNRTHVPLHLLEKAGSISLCHPLPEG